MTQLFQSPIRRKMRFLIAFIFFAACYWQSSYAKSLLNQPLPNFNLPTLTNPQYRLTNQSLKGRVSLLNVWATWCSACQSEHALLMEIKQRYHIPIYGVLYDDNPKAAEQWLNYAGNPYVVAAYDANDQLINALNIYGTPETFVIDRNGVIRYRYSGAMSKQAWLTELLPIIKQLQGSP